MAVTAAPPIEGRSEETPFDLFLSRARRFSEMRDRRANQYRLSGIIRAMFDVTIGLTVANSNLRRIFADFFSVRRRNVMASDSKA
jgi:hypothetical protein